MAKQKEADEKVTMDYRKLSCEQMIKYILDNHNDADSKRAFKEATMKKKAKKKRVPMLDKDDNPVMYKNKKGKEVQRYKLVDADDKEAHETVDIMASKRYFYETYKDEIEFTHAPTGEKKVDVKDILADW